MKGVILFFKIFERIAVRIASSFRSPLQSLSVDSPFSDELKGRLRKLKGESKRYIADPSYGRKLDALNLANDFRAVAGLPPLTFDEAFPREREGGER